MPVKPLPEPMTLDEAATRAVLTLPETAALLRVSRPHIYRMAAQGELPLIHLGERRLVSAPLLIQRLMTPESPSEGRTA